jgi:hypothetical protein
MATPPCATSNRTAIDVRQAAVTTHYFIASGSKNGYRRDLDDGRA